MNDVTDLEENRGSSSVAERLLVPIHRPGIIVFLCNWGPHGAYQSLQDSPGEVPAEVRMVRIPCTGRMSKSLLFRAFEMGAGGVALIGCKTGSCRYGSGTATAQRNVEDTREILKLLGIGAGRLRWGAFLPEEAPALRTFLSGFLDDIRAMGESPVTPAPRGEQAGLDADRARELVLSHNILACQDCGKCSSACPLTLTGKPFSPRGLAGAVISGHLESPEVTRDVWSCLTCGLCYDRCPSAVDFAAFVRDLRQIQNLSGQERQEAHGGFFQSLMRTMTSPLLKIRHWDWLPSEVRTDAQSKTLFFGGCAPYFDTYFRHFLGTRTRTILADALRLLNFFDIFPALLDDERCCGHDLLWSGDRDNFLKLARLNIEAIAGRGMEQVVTACPECYRTLAHDYPQHGIAVPFAVTHLFDLVEREIDKGAVGCEPLDRRITFQDPCRLSRMDGRPDLPRKLLKRVPSKGFEEMQDFGAAALCCGNCAWTGCDSYSKALQIKRLRQARATGSDLLVTACPKCQIHLRCAMQDPFCGNEITMEMTDLTSLLAQTIRWE